MITKEQFYSIQFNKGKFYFVNWLENEVVEQYYLKATLFCDIDNEVVHFRNNDNELIWKIKLDNLFETKEDAEWALEFENIQCIKTLSLPNYKVAKTYIDTNKFILEDNSDFKFLLLSNPNNIIIVDKQQGNQIFNKPLTKANYIEACRLAKKLFLGEVKE